MTRAFALAVAVTLVVVDVLAASGCLLGDVDGIPCGSDDECATDSFCDLAEGVCLAGDPLTGPPNLEIVGASIGEGEPRTFLEIPVDEPVRLLLHAKNKGEARARQIELALSELSCAPILIETSTIATEVDPGDTDTIAIDVEVDPDCANPVPVDWFLRFSGRERRGVFELFHE